MLVYGYAPGGYGGGEIPSQREAVREIAEKATAEGAALAEAAGVEHEVRLKALKPSHALLEAAAEGDARLIVVGSHGEIADPRRDSRLDAVQAAARIRAARARRPGTCLTAYL